MSQHKDETAKATVDKNSIAKNDTDKNSTDKQSAANKLTEKEVIHNIFMDTLEQPINTPTSRPFIDNSVTQHSEKFVQNTAGFNRRRFMQGFGSIGITAVGASSLGLVGCGDDDDNFSTDIGKTISFDHGIASGDPLSDRVILWTRVTPQTTGSRQFTVKWFMARDEQMRNIVKQGEVTTSAVKDYTVKVDVDGLEANTVYYYQFIVGNKGSRVGKTKTLPVGNVNQVKMAVFSCANYPAGFFHAYADAAKRNDLDVCIHLGDYIYEYARTVTDAQGNIVPAYASQNAAAIDREVLPEQEVVSVNEYRARYAQYKTDADLQDLHAIAPMIAVWDDHELANDAYSGGADNHQPNTEGSWDDRKVAALTAYHEWMPIRTETKSEIYRRFDFGNLLSINMLDTRVIGRDKQLNYLDFIKADSMGNVSIDANKFNVATNNPERQLLGLRQSNWLVSQLQQSNATWQVLGQQILMGRMIIPAPVILNLADSRFGVGINAYLGLVNKAQTNPQALTPREQAILAEPSVPYNIDAWDGYGSARELVLNAAKSLNKNLVVLAGDSHNAWANNLTTDNGTAAGVEFATSSVSSPGFEEYIPNIPSATLQGVLLQLIPNLKYTDSSRRGYMVITVTSEACQSEWIFVSDILKQTYSSEVGKTLKVLAGENKISN